MKHRFLVLYDYGQGGVWAFILARSQSEIEKKFPDLKIVRRPPAWMSSEEVARLKTKMTFDIDDRPRGFLASLGKPGVGQRRRTRASGS